MLNIAQSWNLQLKLFQKNLLVDWCPLAQDEESHFPRHEVMLDCPDARVTFPDPKRN